MNTLEESTDTGCDSTDDLSLARNRQMELNQSGCAIALEDDMCSCGDRQSATEFFLLGPVDMGCECESC
jgi:hypothetical protein